MKKYLHILPTVVLIFVANIGLANTDEKDGKAGQEQEQEGRRKANQGEMIQPDGDVPSESPDEVSQEKSASDSEPSESGFKVINQSTMEMDSVKEDEVSKYNFIFYFLYKFKYDAEDTP